MERTEDRKMLYKFFSKKNNRNMYVHSRGAMEYAAELESKAWVKSYETNVILDPDRLARIPMPVPDDDLAVEWTTDFVITHVDGHRVVKEIVPKKCMADADYTMRLEMSRRYWIMDDDGTQWMIVSVDD